MPRMFAIVLCVCLLPFVAGAADVRYFKGTMDVVATSGKSCDKNRRRYQLVLVLARDDDTSTYSGYFGGEHLITGKLSGANPGALEVRYPYHDTQRGTGHRMQLTISDDLLNGVLHDRHLEASTDECNFDTAQIAMKAVHAADEAGTQYHRMHVLYNAQLSRSTALALTRQGRIVDAVAQLEKALEMIDTMQGPENATQEPFLASLANAYIRLGRYEDFNRLFADRFAGIKDQATRSIFTGLRVHALLSLGRSDMGREEFDAALNRFRLALEFDYRNRDVIAAIMSAYVRSGRHDEAIRFLSDTEQRLEQETDKADVRDAIALVYFKKAQKDEKNGKHAEAESALKKAIQLDPNTPLYLITLARWRHKTVGYSEADDLLKKGLERFRDEGARQELQDARSKLRQTEAILKKLRRQDG